MTACGCAPGAAGCRTCLPAGLSVAVRARQQAALLHNPLLKAPRQAMLAIGVAAVLLGVLGFSVSVAASLRTRRTQSAVLAALGVGQRAQAGQLCLEQFALSVPAAAVGLLAGIGLAWLMVPAVTLTTGATDPVPPALPVVPLGLAAALALVTAALPVAAAALSVATQAGPGRPVARGGKMRTLWRRLRAAWVTLTGTGAAASVAFGLLVFASVLASLAIPRDSTGLRTGALRHTVAASPLDSAVLGAIGC